MTTIYYLFLMCINEFYKHLLLYIYMFYLILDYFSISCYTYHLFDKHIITMNIHYDTFTPICWSWKGRVLLSYINLLKSPWIKLIVFIQHIWLLTPNLEAKEQLWQLIEGMLPPLFIYLLGTIYFSLSYGNLMCPYVIIWVGHILIIHLLYFQFRQHVL